MYILGAVRNILQQSANRRTNIQVHTSHHLTCVIASKYQ